MQSDNLLCEHFTSRSQAYVGHLGVHVVVGAAVVVEVVGVVVVVVVVVDTVATVGLLL